MLKFREGSEFEGRRKKKDKRGYLSHMGEKKKNSLTTRRRNETCVERHQKETIS